MFEKKGYILILSLLLLIAALGAWAVVSGAIEHGRRPLLTDHLGPGDTQGGARDRIWRPPPAARGAIARGDDSIRKV